MITTQPSNILIIEPNSGLDTPYKFISGSAPVRVANVERGLKHLSLQSQTIPDIVFISASFSIQKIITFLDALKNVSRTKLIPLIIVVDFNHKISNIPGTTWGDKIGILTSIVSKSEYNSTIHRVFSVV